MAAFAELLGGMTELSPEIVEQIREQARDKASLLGMDEEQAEKGQVNAPQLSSSPPPRTPDSSINSPVTARTAPSRSVTPYVYQNTESEESLGSVIHQRQDTAVDASADSNSLSSFSTDAGSVVRHSASPDDG
jgi:hypothetical protein